MKMQTHRDCGPVLIHNLETNDSADQSLVYNRILNDIRNPFPNTDGFLDDMWDHPFNHAVAIEELSGGTHSLEEVEEVACDGRTYGVLLYIWPFTFHWVMAVTYPDETKDWLWHFGTKWMVSRSLQVP